MATPNDVIGRHFVTLSVSGKSCQKCQENILSAAELKFESTVAIVNAPLLEYDPTMYKDVKIVSIVEIYKSIWFNQCLVMKNIFSFQF